MTLEMVMLKHVVKHAWMVEACASLDAAAATVAFFPQAQPRSIQVKSKSEEVEKSSQPIVADQPCPQQCKQSMVA